MASLDTNLPVRLLVNDDAAQGDAAARILRSGVDAADTLLVPVTVVLEREWVLRSSFGSDEPRVLQAMTQLPETDEIAIASERAVEHAL